MKPSLHHIFRIYANLTNNVTFEPDAYKITPVYFQYDSTTKVFHAQIEYADNIHEKEIKMVFTPPKTAQTFAVLVSNYNFSVKPENSLAAMSYNEGIYIGVDVGRAISMAITIIGLILTTALLFYRKMMGL